jgi:uncharacterized protein YciI
MYFLFVDKIKEGINHQALENVIPAHIEWIGRNTEAGHIVQAGRWGDIGGMVVFRGEEEPAIRDLLAEDPLVASGLIEWDLAPFYPQRDIY